MTNPDPRSVLTAFTFTILMFFKKYILDILDFLMDRIVLDNNVCFGFIQMNVCIVFARESQQAEL